jgi:hypothetical protein
LKYTLVPENIIKYFLILIGKNYCTSLHNHGRKKRTIDQNQNCILISNK